VGRFNIAFSNIRYKRRLGQTEWQATSAPDDIDNESHIHQSIDWARHVRSRATNCPHGLHTSIVDTLKISVLYSILPAMVPSGRGTMMRANSNWEYLD
jgi:hypothetical protein